MNRRKAFLNTGVAALASGLAALAILAVPVRGASWTDRAEYDLVLAIRAEGSPQKKLALLDQWKARFPKSDMRQIRRELYISTYESLGDGARILDTAQEILGEQPDSFVGVYWCALALPGAQGPSADLLASGEKAARQLLSGLNAYFADAKKPASTPADAWQKQKTFSEALAHRALGWIQWQRGAFPAAEQELGAALKLNPNSAELSVWLGAVLALQKQPDKQVGAMWSMARAVSLKDEGALTEVQRRQTTSLLEKMYASYHGEDLAGYADLLAKAAKSPAPPADFRIETAAEVADRKLEERLSRENPELLAWLKIRKKLDAADGDTYFNETLSKSPLPKLKGTVIRWSPETRPDHVVLGLSSPAADEVTLRFAAAHPNPPDLGSQLEFVGTPTAFTRSPFQLTVSVEKEAVEGWPPPPAARKK